MIDGIIGRERGSGRRVSEIRKELGETMDKYVAVFRDERGHPVRARDRAGG